jgi:hypothetical protein
MYANLWLASEHRREHLAWAHDQRRAARVRALKKASRRMARAERRLVDAQVGVLRARAELGS